MSNALHFGRAFSVEKSTHILRRLTQELVGDDHALFHLAAAGDFEALVNLPVDYEQFEDPSDVFNIRQVLAFYQKNASLPLFGVDRAKVAYGKFLEAEELCLSTNRRFRQLGSPGVKRPADSALMFRVQRKISKILGVLPEMDEFVFNFGPGASVGVSRFTNARRKLNAPPTLTSNASRYVKYLRREFPFWTQLSKLVRCDTGKLTFVPKTAKTDRSIVVEPLINTFLQKGVGDFMRKRLKKFGCNLKDQSKNQHLALVGSRDGTFSTIDLSSASDTIAKAVVEELLPYDWWSLLCDLRTPSVKGPNGEIIHLHKFSSMGNGFTFELESLIFFSIASEICGNEVVSVYGDDIIVPTQFYTAVTEALEFFGFVVNNDKSFSSGKFRESCGSDFFGGIDVRPVYVKGALSIKELYRLHNFFHRRFDGRICELLLSYIPKRFHIFGPDGFGDGHLIGGRGKPHNRKRGYHGFVFETYTRRPLERREPLPSDYSAYLLLSTGTAKPRDGDRFTEPLVNPRYCMQWLDLSWLGTERPPAPSTTMYIERGGVEAYRRTRVYYLG